MADSLLAGARDRSRQPALPALQTDDGLGRFPGLGLEPLGGAFPVQARVASGRESNPYSSGAATASHRLPYYPPTVGGTETMSRVGYKFPERLSRVAPHVAEEKKEPKVVFNFDQKPCQTDKNLL